MSRSQPARARLAVIASLVLLALGLASTPTGTPAEAAPAPAPRFVTPEQRVYMVADSVGLGARDYLADAFPADWQVVVDGKPAQFVEKLESLFVRPALDFHPEWFGDHVVVAGGYNYPYWDPDRFDRSIDSMINTLTAAGVKHVHWVTLREVKQEYVSAAAWRHVQQYNFYFPTVNQHLRDALERHPNLRLVEWAWAADRAGVTYDAIHLNPTGARLYSSLIRASVDAAASSVADGSTTRIEVPGGSGKAAAVVNLTTADPRQYGFLTAWACDGPVPTVSAHNYARAQTVAHSAIVPLDATGAFCVFTRSATNLVVDVTGFLSGDEFVVTAPTRWLDTRGDGGPAAASGTTVIDIDDVRSQAGVAADTEVAAVAITLTAVGATSPGFLAASPCGVEPAGSNVNYLDAAPVPNVAVVAPNSNGEICISSLTSTHVLVDLFGVFTEQVDEQPVDEPTDAVVPAAAAERLLDTRLTGGPVAAGATLELDVGNMPGVVLNLTAVDAPTPGFLTAYPCEAGLPNSSSLNVLSPHPVSNAVIVAPDSHGKVCVFTLTSANVIVDVQAQMTDAFAGITPFRVLDTRS
ncbi:MAG TPA: hypothetical protein VMM60_15585 [Ilumatobacter sp.]|nr:hypothetical protein [Ilumatobacter sp.]